MVRRNYLYALPPERLSTAAAAVAAEIRDTARRLVESGAWSGVDLVAPVSA
jgi:LysR family tcuABC transcriptional regulator